MEKCERKSKKDRTEKKTPWESKREKTTRTEDGDTFLMCDVNLCIISVQNKTKEEKRRRDEEMLQRNKGGEKYCHARKEGGDKSKMETEKQQEESR